MSVAWKMNQFLKVPSFVTYLLRDLITADGGSSWRNDSGQAGRNCWETAKSLPQAGMKIGQVVHRGQGDFILILELGTDLIGQLVHDGRVFSDESNCGCEERRGAL